MMEFDEMMSPQEQRQCVTETLEHLAGLIREMTLKRGASEEEADKEASEARFTL